MRGGRTLASRFKWTLRSLLKRPQVLACLPASRSMAWDDWLMQGFERADRQLLDAEMLAGHLDPGGSGFAFLAAPRAGVFPDAEYASLLAPPGVCRSSLPASRM